MSSGDPEPGQDSSRPGDPGPHPPRPPRRIHFVARGLGECWPDLGRLSDADIDRRPERFRGGVNNWIIQTWLRLREPLRAAGFEATISERFERAGLCLSHRDTCNGFFQGSLSSFVVGIRADRPPIHACEFEVVQNPLAVRAQRSFYLPLWPQPGLRARDPGRGERVERIGYFGRSGSLPPWYFDPGFHRRLRELGLVFEIREADWWSYEDVDVVLAVRREAPRMLAEKPASKLVNAWKAGVPALLGPEPAFECLRRSGDDFLRVEDADDAIAALARLKHDPARYRRMVDNGRERAAQYSVEAIRARWLTLLLEEAWPRYERWLTDGPHTKFSDFGRHVLRMARQKLAARSFRARKHAELATLGVPKSGGFACRAPGREQPLAGSHGH